MKVVMNGVFENVKKNFGFGCMRLPMKDGEVEHDKFCEMVDAFMDAGFNYFDTAHGYLGTKSETAVREAVAKRYPRESFILTDKLTEPYFKSEAEIRPFFESQLRACGVDYFDFYLMHCQNAELFRIFKERRAYETALDLKAEGKIRHFGISFHDKADVLDQILTEYPQIEVVQIQFNYADYEDTSVESRKCYEVCRRHSKPVIIMEPVKGGSLVNLPLEAQKVIDSLDGDYSNAAYAIRFAAGFEGVFMVLSGMSDMAQVNDNIGFMRDFKPLSDAERTAVDRVSEILKTKGLIKCTACHYCTDGCPKNIPIPELFSCMNAKKLYNNWNTDYYYESVHTVRAKASDCIKCGKCEASCPQKLPIRDLLCDVAKEFEEK